MPRGFLQECFQPFDYACLRSFSTIHRIGTRLRTFSSRASKRSRTYCRTVHTCNSPFRLGSSAAVQVRHSPLKQEPSPWLFFLAFSSSSPLAFLYQSAWSSRLKNIAQKFLCRRKGRWDGCCGSGRWLIGARSRLLMSWQRSRRFLGWEKCFLMETDLRILILLFVLVMAGFLLQPHNKLFR